METTEKILEKNELTTWDVKLILRRINAGREVDLQSVWDEPRKLLNDEQGRAWLLSKWKSATGRERKNNPYGYREQRVLENYAGIEFAGTYDTGNMHHSYHVPLWNVISKDGDSFQYYMSGGEIHIVG